MQRYKTMIRKILFLPILLLAIACTDKQEKEIAAIPMDFSTIRLDSLFVKTPDAQLSHLCKQYPYFFTATITDQEWIEIRNGLIFPEEPSVQLHYTDLYNEINKSLGTLSAEKKELKSLFQHIKYYFPKFQPPKVVTLISRVDYESRVIYADSLLLIGTDNYLGAKHPYYQDMQQYIAAELDKKYLTVDVAEAFADKLVPRGGVYLTFLDNMVYEGKKLYLLSKLLPQRTIADLLHYAPDKYDWATANEAEIWRYFIEKQLLYNTDKKLLSRFIYPAPFSKFYLELDNESPAQVGRFIGYRIVKAYAEKKTDQELVKLLAMQPEALFKASGYKPQKD